MSKRALAPALVFLAPVVLFGALRWFSPGLVERDGYFHARYAAMMPERGLSRRFEWTTESVWKDRFADKEFLYHLMMGPFTWGSENPVRGAAMFSALLAGGVFLAFYFLLALNKVPLPALFALLLGGMGGPFMLRLHFIRPHSLAILLSIAGLHFLLRRDAKLTAAVGFVLSWSYSFPWVLPAIALPLMLGRWWAEGKLDWRAPAAALGGVFAGLIFHPYFPNSIESALTYFDVLRLAAGPRAWAAVEVGREFAPYSTRAFLLAYPLMSAAILGLGLAGWRSERKLSGEAMGLFCAAAAAFLATLVFARCIEYAAPLTAAALAFAVRDQFGDAGFEKIRTLLRRNTGKAAAAALFVFLFHAHSFIYLVGMNAKGEPPRFRGAAEWMAENLEAGETVVNLWWDDFPDLFYDAHRQRFLVGLDPAHMLRASPEKARKVEGMRLGREPIDADWLAKTFGARTMVVRTTNARFYPQLIAGPWRPVYHDEQAAVFALSGPAGPPAELKGLPQIPALKD
ncbi:MAG: hypothetical protein V3S11_06775 [Elusimicrobiota bacterium]